MIWFIVDQVVSWVTIILGWWIIHQTANAKFSLPTFLMRSGVAGFTLSLMAITAVRAGAIEVSHAGVFLKPFLMVMFLGIILFHYRRFGKL